MATTWGTLRDEIITEFGYLTSDTNLTAKVLEWEKDAVREIVGYHSWWWLREQTVTASTTSSQNYVLLTAGYGKISKIWNATYREEINQVDPRVLIENNYDLTLTGRPQYFWVNDWVAGTSTGAGQVRIQLYPVPDATYTLSINQAPFELGAAVDGASSSTVIPVPSNFYPAIKEFTRSHMCEIDGKPYASDAHLQKFYQTLEQQVLQNMRFNTKKNRLQATDVDSNYAYWGPRLDPNHFP